MILIRERYYKGKMRTAMQQSPLNAHCKINTSAPTPRITLPTCFNGFCFNAEIT